MGLRATVYSPNSGELFWRRPDVPGLRYTVVRDGRTVATTDGVSYYDDALVADRAHVYEVVAIDGDGRRSAPASITLGDDGGNGNGNGNGSGSGSGSGGGSGSGSGGGTGGGGETPPVAALAAPAGVRADVYSSTSAEVTWTRPATFGLTYDVSRDGRRLATTDGVSFYDDTLSGGRSYLYEIVAIDRDGRRSSPSSVMFDTPTRGPAAGEPTAPLTPTDPAPPVEPPPPVTPTEPTTPLPPLTPPPMAGSPLEEPSDYYRRDGYATVDVVRMDVRTVTTPGPCTDDDDSGCTLDDVNADNDPDDGLTVEIPVHFRADDFPDDGKEDNAELRQRGATARLSDQKSYRVELKGKGVRWRGEDRLQLNKNPYDPSKIRNKLAFDLISEIPNLPSMRTQFVDLWIDDGAGPEPYGLFTHVEAAVGEYLENRGWDEDDRLYKAEKFLYAGEDLAFMELDEDGEPVDEDAFESRLEIKGGDDHRTLVKMIRAVNDRDQAFEDVLARHFDEDNVITWVTVNILLRHIDGVTHNFYLYNPVGSEKFYIIPWDYDQTFAFQEFPTGGFGEEDLIRRLNYGYARVSREQLPQAALQDAGLPREGAGEGRAAPERPADGQRHHRAGEPLHRGRHPRRRPTARRVQVRPDVHRRFAEFVSRSHDALRSTYSIPLPPSLATPRAEPNLDRVRFGWSPAYDVTGGSLTYDLEVSRSADLRARAARVSRHAHPRRQRLRAVRRAARSLPVRHALRAARRPRRPGPPPATGRYRATARMSAASGASASRRSRYRRSRTVGAVEAQCRTLRPSTSR